MIIIMYNNNGDNIYMYNIYTQQNNFDSDCSGSP